MLPILLFTFSARAATTWYAAATGTETNGTYAQPWGVQYSVTNSNQHLQPGDTVIFKSGTYFCVETNASVSLGHVLEFRKSGTPSAKITYRAETLWSFHFDGGFWIDQTTTNLVLWGFHLYDSATTNRTKTNDYSFPGGIQTYAPGVDFMHNLIDNVGGVGIGSGQTTHGKYIAGNIIRFVGVNDYTGGFSNSPRGSGMYLQNRTNTSKALIKGNISYFNYTTGMKGYGSINAWDFDFINNIVAEQEEAGILYDQDTVAAPYAGMISNYVWRGGANGLWLGSQASTSLSSNAVISRNYVVDSMLPLFFAADWKAVTNVNNTFVHLSGGVVFELEPVSSSGANVATHTMSGNTYYGLTTTPFTILGVGKTLAEWKTATTEDADAIVAAGRPTNLVSFVHRPSTDTNFAHVAVFNWQTNASTTVDLSTYFAAGATLAIYDAQDVPNAYTNITFSGTTVTLDLTRTNRAAMLGAFTQRPAGGTTWAGFDPRFRAFVVYQTAAAPATGQWYVDSFVVGGTGDGTSWANAYTNYNTVKWGTGGIQSGDTLNISGGTTSKRYDQWSLTMTNNGASRITVRVGQDTGHNGLVVNDGTSVFSVTSGNFTIDGLYAGQTNWLFINGTVNLTQVAVSLTGNSNIVQYVAVSNYNNGIWLGNGGGSNGVVRFCHLQKIRSNFGIAFTGLNAGFAITNLAWIHNNRIDLNVIAFTQGDGPDGIQGCPGLTTFSNRFENFVGTVVYKQDTSYQHSDQIETAAGYQWHIANEHINPVDSSIDVGVGCICERQIINSLFRKTTNSGGTFVRYYNNDVNITDVANLLLANNTFLDHALGGGSQSAVDFRNFGTDTTSPVIAFAGVRVVNNLFVNCGKVGVNSPIYVYPYASPSIAHFGLDYNLFEAGGSGSTNIDFAGLGNQNQPNGRNGLPTFTSYTAGLAANDLHLSSADVLARGRGTNMSAYFTTDKDGVTITGPWTLGAYQAGGAVPFSVKLSGGVSVTSGGLK